MDHLTPLLNNHPEIVDIIIEYVTSVNDSPYVGKPHGIVGICKNMQNLRLISRSIKKSVDLGERYWRYKIKSQPYDNVTENTFRGFLRIKDMHRLIKGGVRFSEVDIHLAI